MPQRQNWRRQQITLGKKGGNARRQMQPMTFDDCGDLSRVRVLASLVIRLVLRAYTVFPYYNQLCRHTHKTLRKTATQICAHLLVVCWCLLWLACWVTCRLHAWWIYERRSCNRLYICMFVCIFIYILVYMCVYLASKVSPSNCLLDCLSGMWVLMR